MLLQRCRNAAELFCHAQELSQQIQLRQADGFTVAKYSSGVAHDTADMHAPLANLHFLVLLQKSNKQQ